MIEANHKLTNTAFWILVIGCTYYFAVLPFQFTFLPASAGMIVAGIGWLINLVSNHKKLIINKYAALVYLSLALFYLTGLPAVKIDEYRQIMNAQIPLLFWGLPFVIYNKEFLQYSKKYLLKIFFVSAVFSALIFIVNFFKIELLSPSLEYSKRSPYYFLPVHYLGLYYNMAIVVLLWHVNLNNKIFRITAVSVLIFAIILLASRIQWIILFSVIIIRFLSANKISSGKIAFYFLALSISAVLLYGFVPEVKRRAHETLDELRSLNHVKNGKQTNHRKFIWKEAFALLKDIPFYGYRPGLADKLLMERLSTCEEKFWDGEKVYYLRDGFYNYHNQFLQAIAERGIGAIFLFLALLLPIIYGKNWLSNMAVFVICLSMLTESILQRQAGVFLVATFLPMVVAISHDSKA